MPRFCPDLLRSILPYVVSSRICLKWGDIYTIATNSLERDVGDSFVEIAMKGISTYIT